MKIYYDALEIKVATCNVAHFKYDRNCLILKSLIANDIDICGMQETRGQLSLDKFLSYTKRYEGVFDNLYPTYGNSIIYRKDKFKLVKSELHVLKDGRNKKGALCVTLESLSETEEHKNKQINVIVTHLDHISEEQRLIEVTNLLNVTDKMENCVILGDFNSLKKNDYTNNAWNAIVACRKESNWETPALDVIKTMEKKDT